MHLQAKPRPDADICVALVDGDPALRRARQLMLLSEHYDVRAYSTCDSLLADSAARRCACLIADVDMPGIGGFDLIERLRAKGWHGSAILLSDAPASEMTERIDQSGISALLPKALANQPLLQAVRQAVAQDHSMSLEQPL